MRLMLILNERSLLAWHTRLIDRLTAHGHRVHVCLEHQETDWPANFSLLRHWECLLSRGSRRQEAQALPQACLEPFLQGFQDQPECIVAIDAGPGVKPTGCPVLRLRFDGGSQAFALNAALDGREAMVEAVLDNGEVLARAFPATEMRKSITDRLGFVFSRAMTVIDTALRRIDHEGFEASGLPFVQHAPAKPFNLMAGVLGFAGQFAKTVSARIAMRLQQQALIGEHWRVGWRRIGAGQGVIEQLCLPSAPYTILPDDGRRYYADPFPFHWQGRLHVFVEEWPYETEKGVISVCEIGPEGVLSSPRIVLERPYHLSYPFVFEAGGQVFMLPETGAAGRIELYRADPYPDRWVLEQVLVEGIDSGDPTLIMHQGRFWLFATERCDGGSVHDCLSLFHADALLGQWQRHPGNPVLMDAGSARPAGRIERIGEKLIRSVQDCGPAYGAALALRQIDRLDLDGFAETTLAHLAAPHDWLATGLHTLNQRGGIETIDVRAPRNRSGMLAGC
jgi:hypothetical protein